MSDQHCYQWMRLFGYDTPTNPELALFQAEVFALVEHISDVVLLEVNELDNRIVHDPTRIIPWVLERRGKYKNREALLKVVRKECLDAWI